MSERIKIKKKKKLKKLVGNLRDKAEYVIHIRNLKQALNHRLVLKKMQRIIKFKQKNLVEIMYWYEPRFKKKSKNGFEEDFCKMMNNGETILCQNQFIILQSFLLKIC